jgi:hypothetical protein
MSLKCATIFPLIPWMMNYTKSATIILTLKMLLTLLHTKKFSVTISGLRREISWIKSSSHHLFFALNFEFEQLSCYRWKCDDAWTK